MIVQRMHLPAAEVEIAIKEVTRYMGMGAAAPEGPLLHHVEEALAEFRETVQYHACYAQVPVAAAEGGLNLGGFYAQGKSLAKHLAGCEGAILFAATTGLEAERRRKRALVLSPAYGLVLDALGTAAIEAFCDVLCARWAAEYPETAFRPRFSPGYGDLPLKAQRPLLDFLAARQNAGISLTDALLMVPQKSVSAIVGMGREGCTAKKTGCAACTNQNCAFRL